MRASLCGTVRELAEPNKARQVVGRRAEPLPFASLDIYFGLLCLRFAIVLADISVVVHSAHNPTRP